MNTCLLAIDVGNSRTKLGRFAVGPIRAEGESALPVCRQFAVVDRAANIPWEQIRQWPEDGALRGVIAGTNPAGVTHVLESWPRDEWPEPIVVSDGTQFPLAIQVDEPHKVGIDRLLNAVAANAIRPMGRSAVIVDSGTATTVDLVTPNGAFRGGAILPGFELMARALHHYTALLPLISIEELAQAQHHPLGRNTRTALHSGLFWGQLGAIRELIKQLAQWAAAESDLNPAAGRAPTEEAADEMPPVLVLTGGGASLLASHFPEALLEPHFALQGLVLVAETAFDLDR